MKNIVYILMIVCGFSFSQETIIPIENLSNTNRNGTSITYYFKDVNNVLDKFIGTWKYETSTESFEITFTKVLHEFTNGDFTDMIGGQYKYIKNGITIIDTNTLDFVDEGYLIFGSLIKDNNKKMSLFYCEPNQDRGWEARAIITFNPPSSLGGMPSLLWHIDTLSRKIEAGELVYPFNVPENFVLNKI